VEEREVLWFVPLVGSGLLAGRNVSSTEETKYGLKALTLRVFTYLLMPAHQIPQHPERRVVQLENKPRKGSVPAERISLPIVGAGDLLEEDTVHFRWQAKDVNDLPTRRWIPVNVDGRLDPVVLVRGFNLLDLEA
jgi:hypothetical protein